MGNPGVTIGVCRPIRTIPGSVKKLVEQKALEVESQLQEINIITQQNDRAKRKDKAQAATK